MTWQCEPREVETPQIVVSSPSDVDQSGWLAGDGTGKHGHDRVLPTEWELCRRPFTGRVKPPEAPALGIDDLLAIGRPRGLKGITGAEDTGFRDRFEVVPHSNNPQRCPSPECYRAPVRRHRGVVVRLTGSGRGQCVLLARFDRHDEEPFRLPGSGRVHDNERTAVREPREIGWDDNTLTYVELAYSVLGSTERRHEDQLTSTRDLAAEKGDPSPVGRPGGAEIACRVIRSPHLGARADPLHVDVLVFLTGTRPRERDLLAVRRERRRAFRALERRQRCHLRSRGCGWTLTRPREVAGDEHHRHQQHQPGPLPSRSGVRRLCLRSGPGFFPHVLERNLDVRDVLIAPCRIFPEAVRHDLREVRRH